MMIIAVACILTYIIPAGEYKREEKGGQTLVVQGLTMKLHNTAYPF